MKLKIKNFKNDQIKIRKKKQNKLTLFVSFCLLLVLPKTTCKNKEGGGSTIWGNRSGEQQQQGAKGTLKMREQ